MANEVEKSVRKYNDKYKDKVYFINTVGWIPVEPIHPRRDGHKIVSKKLADEIRKIMTK